ncbi:DUF1217 domain-containing protein [Paracoccus sp. S-4012]|uniref:DUF1217 domain-containing protein n=1 Tax=Paracoccus sp. S-4012 TaxID=2665648 RepID=UPI0012AFD453|nr:DUF1217 domain-containing protein [Paracoccus sp. S-4012]MRX49016.1 DUF1217 domain-containing protein [Paracoccus sp. S-4012]
MRPLVGGGGLAGWRLLQRTSGQQLSALARDPQVARERARFEAGADKLDSAQALVGDYQMLKVALSAFGLEADLPNKAFLRKVMESDLSDPKSLANRLTDKRYRQLAETFGLGAGGVPPEPDAIAARVSGLYLEREFERRVGEVDGNLRLAMNAGRELASIAGRSSSDRTKWFEVMGTPPLRQVMEAALGLPKETIRMPIDRQVELFAETASRRLGIGSFNQLEDPATMSRIVDAFLARASLQATAVSGPWNAALAILRG